MSSEVIFKVVKWDTLSNDLHSHTTLNFLLLNGPPWKKKNVIPKLLLPTHRHSRETGGRQKALGITILWGLVEGNDVRESLSEEEKESRKSCLSGRSQACAKRDKEFLPGHIFPVWYSDDGFIPPLLGCRGASSWHIVSSFFGQEFLFLGTGENWKHLSQKKLKFRSAFEGGVQGRPINPEGQSACAICDTPHGVLPVLVETMLPGRAA